MPALLSPEQDQDEALNKGQQGYEERFNSGAGSLDDLKSAEEGGTGSSLDSGDSMNYTGGESKGSGIGGKSKGSFFTKKKGGIAALIIGLLGGGGIMVGMFGPMSMLFNLAENIGIKNDSSSVAMERRFIKAFSHMTDPKNPVCEGSRITMKCRMGRISNSALNSLNKKGIVAIFDDGPWDGKKTGYPPKNPSSYEFTSSDGSKTIVPANGMRDFLSDKKNAKFAAQVLGRKGAFNMRTKAWVGKHINSKLYKVFGIERKGGLADGENGGKKKMTTREKLAAALDKQRKKIPGMEAADKIADGIKEKAKGHMSKAGKGGAAYTTAYAGCIAIKAPSYIAAGVAAVQLAQVMPFFMDYIGSPSSKAKQSGIGSGFTGDDMDTVGSALTEKVNGKSALDSQVLLSVLGVNKNKAPVAKSVTPGYAVMKNPIVKFGKQAEGQSKEACSAIMSPTAMYTAMTVDAAVTVAASATILGGIIKLAAGIAVTVIATEVATAVVGDLAKNAIKEVAENDAIPKAKGEELGDVLGVSASAFYASGGMARHLPVLKQSQLSAFNDMKMESLEFQKEMDIASLSPFDTSSPYTFLGSIVHNTRTAMLSSGGYVNILSSISTLASTSLSSLFSSAGASSNITAAMGGYASDFDLDMKESSETPCITISGLPCTGLTTTQASMSTASAISYMTDVEGWVDAGSSTKDGAVTSDLIGSIIKEDTPLSEFMESCSSAENGEYLFTAAGCTSTTTNADYSSGSGTTIVGAEGGELSSIDMSEVDGVSNDVQLAKDPNSLAAMTPFLLDYQIIQSINGEDEEKSEETKKGVGIPDGLKYYGQCQEGSDWKDLTYGPAGTACHNACGPTSMAIIVASLADSNITPKDAIDNSIAHFGGNASSVVYGTNEPQFAFAEKHGLKVHSSGGIDAAIEFVKSGKGMSLINSTGAYPSTGGGHVLVLAGVTDSGMLVVADPYASASSDPNAKDVGEYSKEHMASIGFTWSNIGK